RLHVLCHPHHHRQGRQRQADARWKLAPGFRDRVRVRFAIVAGAAEGRIVAVQELAVAPGSRCTEDVAVARYWRAVEYDQEMRAAFAGQALAHEGEYALVAIVRVEPAKTFPLMLARVQLRVLAVDAIEGAVPCLQLLMMRMLQSRPGEIFIVAPLVPLAELAAHEYELL